MSLTHLPAANSRTNNDFTGSTFQEIANMTYAAAAYLFGRNSLEQQAVRKAWTGVGINVADTPPSTNPGCLPGLLKMLKIQPR